MSDHTCPITGCTATVPNSKLMCAGHWRKVPPPLASKLYLAYHRRNRGEDGALAEHAQAMENCIAAVESREPRTLFT